nr:MAG TPA: hypothetical protein [Caudoviricetes sp.]DAP34691.1 MAG TPA: hypothetical protein [Caudoviricetes sp.]
MASSALSCVSELLLYGSFYLSSFGLYSSVPLSM